MKDILTLYNQHNRYVLNLNIWTTNTHFKTISFHENQYFEVLTYPLQAFLQTVCNNYLNCFLSSKIISSHIISSQYFSFQLQTKGETMWILCPTLWTMPEYWLYLSKLTWNFRNIFCTQKLLFCSKHHVSARNWKFWKIEIFYSIYHLKSQFRNFPEIFFSKKSLSARIKKSLLRMTLKISKNWKIFYFYTAEAQNFEILGKIFFTKNRTFWAWMKLKILKHFLKYWKFSILHL